MCRYVEKKDFVFFSCLVFFKCCLTYCIDLFGLMWCFLKFFSSLSSAPGGADAV